MDWDEILKRIGAKKSEWRLIKSELRELSEKMQEGNLMTGEEITKLRQAWKSDNPFTDESGRPFVLFIYDRSPRWSFLQYGSKYKFHFKWCKTLEQMDKAGRSARYKAKYDIENPLFDSSSDKKEVLDVCQNCINGFDFNEPKPTIKEFNIKEFFDTYGIQKDLRTPTHQYHTHTYTPDWHKISREYKKSQNWKCEECGKKFSGNTLHTHHINGVKDDNRPSNLKALCPEHHEEQPGHTGAITKPK